jgi:glycosyltransferase involved in cell wall biosynthesis
MNIRSITIYTPGDFPYGMAGENFVRQMAIGIKLNKVNVHVVRMHGQKYATENDTGIDGSDLLFRRTPKHDIIKLFEIIALLFIVPISVLKQRLKNRVDAIILFDVRYFYFILPFQIATKMLNIKLIRIITDYSSPLSIAPVWWKKPKLFFHNLQFKHFDKYLDGIIVLSSYLSNLILKSGIHSSRINVIPHFIDMEGFIDNNKKIEKNSKIRIGFCGTPHELNGIFDLIEAFLTVKQKYDNAELLIIGAPADDNMVRIDRKLQYLKDSYHITGFLNKEHVAQALLSCDILVNPRKSGNRAEAGFPTKLGEYFGTKIPVVSTSVGDIVRYFNDKVQLVLVEPDNPAKLAEGICFLIENPEKAREIGVNGFNWALCNLDYKANAKKLIGFINTV